MKNNYEAVVFDLDGTLLDTTEGIINALKYAMVEKKLPIPAENILKSFIGPPIEYSFEQLYDLDNKEIKDIATIFRKQYKEHELLKAKSYEGIYDVFDGLVKAGIKISIATYKREEYACTLLKYFGFDKYTNIIHGADSKGLLKKKDIIELCLKEMGTSDYSRVVMIGDSDNDAIGAAEIGTKFLGVLYGFGFSNAKDVDKFESIGSAIEPLKLLETLL